MLFQTQAFSLDKDGVEIEIDLIPGETYELVGPKVQGNPYRCGCGGAKSGGGGGSSGSGGDAGGGISSIPSPAPTPESSSKKAVPRHYLIKHGAILADGWDMRAFLAAPLPYATAYITSKKIEGVVMHCDDGTSLKINRGHIGVPLSPGEELRLS